MYDKNPRYLMKSEGTTESIMTQNNIKLNIIYFSNKIKFCYSFYNMTFFLCAYRSFLNKIENETAGNSMSLV